MMIARLSRAKQMAVSAFGDVAPDLVIHETCEAQPLSIASDMTKETNAIVRGKLNGTAAFRAGVFRGREIFDTSSNNI